MSCEDTLRTKMAQWPVLTSRRTAALVVAMITEHPSAEGANMNWDSERVAGFLAREQRRLEQDIKRMKDQVAYDPEGDDLSEPIAEAEGQLAICAQLKGS